EQEERRQPIGSPLVQRDAGEGGLMFRTIDDAVVEPAQAQDDPAQWEAWERWMSGHLDIEREAMLDGVAEFVTEMLNRERVAFHPKLAELQGETRELKSMLVDVLRRYEQTTKAIATIEARATAEAERVREIRLDVRDELQTLDAKQTEITRLYTEL